MRPSSLAFLGLVSCATASGGDGAPSTVVVASGGAVGANCSVENSIGCAPGFAEKVRCKASTWQSDGACTGGTTCSETKQGATVTATFCVHPPPPDLNRAAACVKLDACALQT